MRVKKKYGGYIRAAKIAARGARVRWGAAEIIPMLFVIWFGSNAYLYLFTSTGFKPLYSYLILAAYFLLWAVTRSKLDVSTGGGVKPLLVWLFVYLLYGDLEYFNSTQDAVAEQALITLSEAILLSGIFLLLFAEHIRLVRVQIALAWLAMVAVVVNVFDFLHPFFTNVPGRAAGLYINPNTAGQFITMAMIAAYGVVPRRLRVVFALVCGLGVLLTFSRAAWLLWGLSMVWLGWAKAGGRGRRRWITAVLAGAIGLGAIFALFTGSFGYVADQGAFATHLDANTLARLGVGASSLSGDSANLREQLIGASLRIGAEAPWIGHGIGYTNEWQFPVGPHDMYLLFWVEGGMLGLLLYIALMVLLWRNSSGSGRIMVMQLIVAGLFTHNQMEQPAFLMMMAFAVAHHAVVSRQRSDRAWLQQFGLLRSQGRSA